LTKSQGSTLFEAGAASASSRPKTVAANACKNCHAPHAAAGRKQLLVTARQEQACFICHNGTVVRQNIETEFNKHSVHPVLQSSQSTDSVHSALSPSRQVTCSDCHNSHAARKLTAPAPRASGAILGVKGVTRSGAVANSVTDEYELCFRCHGDSQGRVKPSVDRLAPQTNLRLAFDPSGNSFHPVVAVGKNSRVPSLIAPYTPGSMIKCTDCHNNDQGPAAGGSGPRGPHGSAFAPLLERQLVTADFIGESAANDALCYKCHNRESILSDQSFRAMNAQGQDRGHRFHVVDQKAACTTCHDSHGVANGKHLINFNPDYVTPSSNHRIQYISTGVLRGTCTLTCHGADHTGTTYPNLQPAASQPRPVRSR
jgi:predicted CXXCH cytochrome family protein